MPNPKDDDTVRTELAVINQRVTEVEKDVSEIKSALVVQSDGMNTKLDSVNLEVGHIKTQVTFARGAIAAVIILTPVITALASAAASGLSVWFFK